MEQCKIINYTEEWRNSLHNYMRKTFPLKSDAYINYCLDHSSDERMPSIIVVNANGDVVGCHLYFCTKALINGEEIETQWGHDTFLDKEYRASMGLDLMLSIKSKQGFGLGLTDTNEKLQKIMKAVFFKGVYNYYIPGWRIIFSPFQKMLKTKPILYSKDILKVGKRVFKRVSDSNHISIPNGGYWFKEDRDIDFIRDADFLNQRFVKNNVHKYVMYFSDYKGTPCYFVMRQTSYRGMPAVTLCDFRYCNKDKEAVSLIIKAVKNIMAKSKIGILFFVCGDMYMDRSFKGKIHYKTPIDFVGSKGMDPNWSYCITGADSDADFLKG